MLIVSSLPGAPAAYARHRPGRVISILSEGEAPPTFEGLAAGAHLRLCVARESCSRSIDAAARARASEIVSFLKDWDGSGDILLHCMRGVSRSTAAAYIILCMRKPAGAEAAIAQELRRAAPHADPCPLLVSYADDLLARGGRMADAIDDLPPPAPAIEAPTVLLPL